MWGGDCGGVELGRVGFAEGLGGKDLKLSLRILPGVGRKAGFDGEVGEEFFKGEVVFGSNFRKKESLAVVETENDAVGTKLDLVG